MNSPRNLAASVRARLLSKARASGVDFNLMLTRYALERMLYRLSTSCVRDQFLLKGALLFDLWFEQPHRPTHDVDLLGFGSADIPHLEQVFRDVCQIAGDDGMVYLADTVKAEEIRKEANYAGVRLTLVGLLDGARCPVQIDVGFGDTVVPGPEEAAYPAILEDMPRAHLRVYPRETVVAEKLEALTSLGMLNSRLKDYFDLWVLARHSELDGNILAQAIAATFERRSTAQPTGLPLGLSAEFALDAQKTHQWQAFTRKNKLQAPSLAEVVEQVRLFLQPVLDALGADKPFRLRWRASTGWVAGADQR